MNLQSTVTDFKLDEGDFWTTLSVTVTLVDEKILRTIESQLND